jgi:catechol 2,3-dioxygenase-like lactoylglutathione lyase family enzyme
MIDHVSLGVRDLARSTALYERALAALGHHKLVSREHTVGFGKQYPELWLNYRASLGSQEGSGVHVCLRARSPEQVEQFYRAALEAGARDDGPPGFRPEYHARYFAAFIRDFDGNSVEVVTFVELE